jgi:hypothetical protein
MQHAEDFSPINLSKKYTSYIRTVPEHCGLQAIYWKGKWPLLQKGLKTIDVKHLQT